MKNTTILSGRLPGFEGKYTPANGDKKSRMNWAMNVQLSTKNEQGYYDESLINFTAWGWFADQLQQVNQMDKESRKDFAALNITGRINAGYKDKEGNIVNQVSLDVSEFEFVKRLPSTNQGTSNAPTDNAFTNNKPSGGFVPGGNPMGGVTGAPGGFTPGGFVPGGNGGPRF